MDKFYPSAVFFFFVIQEEEVRSSLSKVGLNEENKLREAEDEEQW